MILKDDGGVVENPFFHRGAIRAPAYFSNRKTEVKRSHEMLGKRQSISVTGPRKIGKTSFLFYISQPGVMQQHGLDPTRHLFVYINCEGLGNLDREALYFLILQEIAEKGSQQGLKLEVPSRLDSYVSFQHSLSSMLARNLKLTLLFDEFEWLSENRNLGGEFFSGLRALATRLDIAYVTVSQDPLLNVCQTSDASALFNIFSEVKLGLFNKADSQDLIESYMRKTEATLGQQVIDMVLELGGGHPYFLQVSGYWALELQYTKGAPREHQDLRILEQSMYSQIESHLKYYWGRLKPEAQYVLAALSLTLGEEKYREELESLVGLCLIVKEDGQYKYFSPLFREFVRRQEVQNVLQAGPFVLSMPQQQALLREKLLPLNARQFALLAYLMKHQGQVVSDSELDREVLGTLDNQHDESLREDRLKSAIRDLRRALGGEAEYIANRRGVGYIFQVQTED